MQISEGTGDADALVGMFDGTFSASEGVEEGRTIAGLVSQLLAHPDPDAVLVFRAGSDAAALMSALSVEGAPVGWLLSPVAVQPERQGQGVGQALLRHALGAVFARGTSLVMTYGDPAFYGRVGFEAAPVEDFPPPYPLSQPVGWLVAGPDGTRPAPVGGTLLPLPPFQDPALW